MPSIPPAESRATILDVAQRAGVSRTTVSRTMNHPERVPEATRSRVLAAIDDLEFRPSPRARSLRTGRSDTIALLVGDIALPFQGELAKAVARAAEASGLSLILCDLDHRAANLERFLRRLPEQGVDGIIVATADDLPSPDIRDRVRELTTAGTPVVFSGRPSDEGIDGVEVDFAAVGTEAARLVGTAEHPLALIGDGLGHIGRRFVEGMLAEFDARGTALEVIGAEVAADQIPDALAERFSVSAGPDAVLAATVPLALRALRTAADAGRRVPQDVAVVACENVALAELATPAITTVGVPSHLSGRALVDRLLARLTGAEVDLTPLATETVQRASTR